jgi:hypothetical protein
MKHAEHREAQMPDEGVGARTQARTDRPRTRPLDVMNPRISNFSAEVLEGIEARGIQEAIDQSGFWLSPAVIDPDTCAELASLYEGSEALFRSTVSMARYGFGQGEYKYFARPLPQTVDGLRKVLYRSMAPVANAWNVRLGRPADWPAEHETLVERCAAAGQSRPTPLLLRYGVGDFNCLHQDLYGEIHFPLQAIVLLDRPREDFDGGELLLVEQRPRKQSRPRVIPMAQGAIAVIPVKERPVETVRGVSRIQVRHGVSEVRRGLRRTLGIIFHDAA